MLSADCYDRVLSALAVWREARGCSRDVKLAVAHVIRNRVQDAASRWPPRASEVVLQPRQFSSFNPTDPNAVKLPWPTDEAWLECCLAVDMSIESNAADPSKGATHFYAPAGVTTAPAWAVSASLTVELGPFRFYRL